MSRRNVAAVADRREDSPDEDDPERYSSDDDDDDNGDFGLMRDLNAEEMDKLVQLQDMTGLEDLAICRALLESKDWDLDATAREQLDIPRNRVQPQQREERPLPQLPVAPNLASVRAVPRRGAAAARGRELMNSILEWGYYLFTLPVTLPVRLTYNVIHGLYGAIATILGLPALGGPPHLRANGHVTIGNPVADVRKFRENFETKYGLLHPTFHIGSYAQMLEEAKKELRFALVYLHSPEHQDTDEFCSQTISNPEFCEYLHANRVLFWACSVETAEGHRVSQALREGTYPFLAVIVLRQNRMMLVGRIEGKIRADTLVQRLESVIRDNEAFVVAARVEREERSMNQSIREEQDAAFRETLRQDQEKERVKREAEEKKLREAEEEMRLEREERERKERIRQMKIELVDDVPEEPAADHPDVVKMLIKLPGGQRLERRFLKSQSLKDLYLFVFCHPESPDEFDITTNFPKKVLNCKPENSDPPSFEEAGLGQSTMLFVHDLEA